MVRCTTPYLFSYAVCVRILLTTNFIDAVLTYLTRLTIYGLNSLLFQSVSSGAVVNNELLNVFVERRRERNAKPDCEPESKRRKVTPKDDIGLYNS